jgi:subtilisin family serine protease
MNQPIEPSPPPSAPETDWPGIVFAVLTFFWIVFISLAIHIPGWFVDQIMMIMGISWPAWAWPLLSLGHAFLLLLPLAPLALFWRPQPARAIFQTWTLAAIFVLLLAPARFAPVTAMMLVRALQITFTFIFLLLLLGLMFWRRNRAPAPENSRRTVIWLALLAVAPVSYPWLALGALGSLLDTLLALLAGLLFGLAAALILSRVLLPALRRTTLTAGRMVILGGFVAGALLLVMAAGFGFNGMQILLLISLSPLGWAAVALALYGNAASCNRFGLALFIGLATAVPLMFIDPAELQLILGGDEIIQWALYATLTGWLVGALVSLALLPFAALRQRAPAENLPWRTGATTDESPLPAAHRPLSSEEPPAARTRLALLLAAVVMAWVIGVLIYSQTGQPGLHGDRIFVIFKDQADLSTAVDIDDLTQRRRIVYQTLVSHADSSQAEIRQTLDRLNVPYTPYYLVNAIELDANPALRAWIALRPEVERVLDSPVLRPLPGTRTISTGQENGPTAPDWNLTLIKADQVWQEFGVTGAGVIIGQSDSGVEWGHPELAAQYRGGADDHHYNWFDPWYGSREPSDLGGHGTHTLGSILGRSTGVAPGATWFGCANLRRNLANPALYLDCMQFMLAPFPLGGDPFSDGDPARAADVLNNSWGCPEIEGCDPGALQAATAALRAAGIFVVASAGNEGPACSSVSSPIALYDEVFSVGAIDRRGDLADFSSRGPVTADGSGRIKPDIVAPGVDVLSAFPGGTYSRADGTSMAGPHVAGVVALIWSANPTLRGDIVQTERILIETVQPYRGPLPDCGQTTGTPNNGVGYGIVDAYAAVQRALELGR